MTEKELIKQILIKQVKKEQIKKYYHVFVFLLIICIAILVFYLFSVREQQTLSSSVPSNFIQTSQQTPANEYRQPTSIDSICHNNKKDSLEKGVDCGGICIKKCP